MRELGAVEAVNVYRIIVVLMCCLNIAYELHIGYLLYLYYEIQYIRILSIFTIIVNVMLVLGLVFKLRFLEVLCAALFILSCCCYTMSFLPLHWRAFLRFVRSISSYLFVFFVYDVLFIGCFPGYAVASLFRLIYSRQFSVRLWMIVVTYAIIFIVSYSLYRIFRERLGRR